MESVKLILANNGISEYQIVIPFAASEALEHTAKELQVFLQKISGAKLPVVTDDHPLVSAAILLGNSCHLAQLNCNIDFDKLGSDGFTIRTVGNHLVIAGSEMRGTLYGVYAFLEDHLGCRWYSSKVSRIPKMSTIAIDPIDDTQVPALDFREIYCADAMNYDFAARLKLNGTASQMKDNRLIYERHNGWGSWCHTSFTFVPPDKYFEEHPEYFSFIEGKRQTKQLCFTNPDVFDITVARINELFINPQGLDFSNFPHSVTATPRRFEEEPIWADKEDIYWDVSQMDNREYCECPDCKALNEREGTPMASILSFINRIAAQFPDRTISTLAYQYSLKPPKTIRPASNVSIMLCPHGCNRGVGIADSPFKEDKIFKQAVDDWAVSDNIFIWDYVVNFLYLMAPSPNLRTHKPNIKFFVDHKTKGVFSQASREVGGEFCELRNYLIAKLLWNPNADVDAIIDDFLDGYYGLAAKSIREYIDLLHNSAEKAGKPIGLNDHPGKHREGFLKPELIAQYNAIFDQAESLVSDNKEFLFRVRTARMPIMYVQVELEVGTPEERMYIINEFVDLAKRNNIHRLVEDMDISPEQFRKKHLDYLKRQRGVKIFPAGGYLCDDIDVPVELTCDTSGAQLRYTTDGSDPTGSSTLYSSPFSLSGPAVVKMRAFHEGKALSAAGSAVFRQANVPFESEVMGVADEAVLVKLPVRGQKQLKLIINDTGDGIDNDYGDWADAKLIDKEGKITYLTDLPVISEKQGRGTLGVGKNAVGDILRIGCRRFDRGLGAHANSEIIYNLDARYEYFEALIGVDAEAYHGASVIFKLETSN